MYRKKLLPRSKYSEYIHESVSSRQFSFEIKTEQYAI